MNKSHNRLFLFLVLYTFGLCSCEINKDQQIALRNAGFNGLVLGAVGLGSYVAWTCYIPEDFYVKNSHPYAQVWYDEMADKYPQAHLHDKKFLSARRGIFNNAVSWESAYNDVYAPAGDLQRIHEIYKNKSENVAITEEDRLVLSICEFLLLHEAAHIEYKDSLGRLSVLGSFLIAQELATALYRSTGMYNPIVNVDYFGQENRLDQYCGLASCFIGWIAYVRYTESRADTFACDHAQDLEVLQAGKKLFTHLDAIALAAQDPNHDDYDFARYIVSYPSLRWMIDFLQDYEHPELSVRAQAITDEIERRLQVVQSDMQI